MIEVKEIFTDEARLLCRRYSFKTDCYDRIFRLSEGEITGVGVMRMEKGVVYITRCVSEGPQSYFRLLLCTMLSHVARLKGVQTVITLEGDFSRYGFKKERGVWRAESHSIVFPHECKGDV